MRFAHFQATSTTGRKSKCVFVCMNISRSVTFCSHTIKWKRIIFIKRWSNRNQVKYMLFTKRIVDRWSIHAAIRFVPKFQWVLFFVMLFNILVNCVILWWAFERVNGYYTRDLYTCLMCSLPCEEESKAYRRIQFNNK